jgi:oxygen-independent coproporphyrinogen-3 oxidase
VHLYVHVPFCSRRCSYCDFAIAVRREVPVDEFVTGVAREIEIRALGADTLDTVYVGGGTPSKLGGAGLAALLTRIRDRFTIASDAELTIEANPEDVTPDNVRAWRSAGVNRLSIGAQSFDDRVLEWMHRTHTASATEAAARAARDGGITDLSLDLIFALPEQLNRDLARDLDRIIALDADHLSAYGLTVETHTPLGRWSARGEVAEMPEERWADEFMQVHDALERAGYAHYEVSNYARNARVAKHNSAYWQDRHYIGLGPSAHGFDGVIRRWNAPAYAHWLAQVAQGADPVEGSEKLSVEQRSAERVYLGLRTRNGLSITPDEAGFVRPWIDAGWAVLNDRHDSRILSLSPAGWMRLDALAAALTDFRSR